MIDQALTVLVVLVIAGTAIATIDWLLARPGAAPVNDTIDRILGADHE